MSESSGDLTSPRIGRTDDWLSFALGALVSLPLSYPRPPYYLIAFILLAGSLLVISLRRIKVAGYLIALLSLALCAVGFVANASSPYDYVLSPERFVSTSVFPIFFLFGLAVRDHERFLSGFVAGAAIQSVIVIAAAVFYVRWSAGLLIFTAPNLRLWGYDLFPDWPNFYCTILACGFMLAFTRGHPAMALLCLAAAVLTTSRTSLLAAGVALSWFILFGRTSGKLRLGALIAVTLIAIGAIIVVGISPNAQELIARMTNFSDRAELLINAFNLIRDNLLIGVGGVLFDRSVGNTGAESFHNSYIDVLVRNGLVGFAVYAVILLVPVFLLRRSDPIFPLVIFLLVGAFFQNLLRHPHIAMLYSVLLMYASERYRRPMSRGGHFGAGSRVDEADIGNAAIVRSKAVL